MSLNLFLQSIVTSSQTIIRNVNSYDFKLQRVPSPLSGFMQSYGRISSAFTPERLPVDSGINTSTCLSYSSKSNHPHCAAVQAFVVDVSVIGSVASIALCWVNRLIIPLIQRGNWNERILEDDEVILELDMTSTDASFAKPKRNISTQSSMPRILLLCTFMVCSFGALSIALYAQVMVIPDALSVWKRMSLSSDNFQKTNLRSVSRLHESLINSTSVLNVILAESKYSIETRWFYSQLTASSQIAKLNTWKRLSQNVTNLTEAFFATQQRPGTCASCRNEQLVAGSLDVGGGHIIPNISVDAPASKFWNSTAVLSSLNMLQSLFPNETRSYGNVSSFIIDNSQVLDNVVKAIFAIWSMEVACLLTKALLIPAAIWLLHKKHLKGIQLSQAIDFDNKKLFRLSITTSRYLKWFALFVAVLSLILWICTAFSFSIGRYFDEICVGMEHNSPTFIAVQSFLFNPSISKYLDSCASASGNTNIKFGAPLSVMIVELAAYNISFAYNFSGFIDQIDQRVMQSQSAVAVKSSLTLETALDSFSNYGKQITSYLTLVNQLSGLKCFWGNITLCNSCQRCTSLSEQMDFQFKYNDLISVEMSIMAINHAIQLNAAALAEFKQAALLDQMALQNLRIEVVSQVKKSSDSFGTVAAALKSEWDCLGQTNALPDYQIFKSVMCDVNSHSATAVVQISWLTFAVSALFFQWSSIIFLFLSGHFLLSASQFCGWIEKDGKNDSGTVLNDISLSSMDLFTPAQSSITSAVKEDDPRDKPLDSQVFQRISTEGQPRSKRFVPLSAPAKGSSSL